MLIGRRGLNQIITVKSVHDNKQLLDEVFVISGIIKVEVSVNYQLKPKAEADNTNRDLDYSGYHKNRI